MSHHLAVLKQAGLVEDQQIIYSLNTTVLQRRWAGSWISRRRGGLMAGGPSGAGRVKRVGQAGWNRWILPAALTVLLAGGSASASQEATDAVVMAAALTEHLHASRFAEVEATFSDELKAALPPGGMEAVWRSLLAQLGEFGATSDPYVASEGPPVEVRQPVTFDAGIVDFRGTIR